MNKCSFCSVSTKFKNHFESSNRKSELNYCIPVINARHFVYSSRGIDWTLFGIKSTIQTRSESLGSHSFLATFDQILPVISILSSHIYAFLMESELMVTRMILLCGNVCIPNVRDVCRDGLWRIGRMNYFVMGSNCKCGLLSQRGWYSTKHLIKQIGSPLYILYACFLKLFSVLLARNYLINFLIYVLVFQLPLKFISKICS